jgi:phosphoglycolate phosphatase-like HAD superfamily hydrolase
VTTPIATGLDLDGTLIDTTLRQKSALIQAAKSLGVELPEDFPDRYYEEKRRGTSGKEVLIRHNISKADEISARWTEIIEDQAFLALDSLYTHVKEQMRRMLREGFVFYVVTARQHEGRAVQQIKHLGLSPLISELFVTRHGPQGQPMAAKHQLTADLGLKAIVGDTEMDMDWAEQLRAAFFPLSCGSRCREFWLERGLSPYESAASALECLRTTGFATSA